METFREMRRKKQMMSIDDCIAVLERNTSGVLSVIGDNGYPYGVPLSYVLYGGDLYFHCAKQGHKLDALKNCNKVSFCVIDQDNVVPEKFTTYFRSVIVFGRAEIQENDGDICAALEKLAEKYSPEVSAEHINSTIEKERSVTCIVKIIPDHISGKEAIELKKSPDQFTAQPAPLN